MQQDVCSKLFPVFVAAVAVFVWASSRSLPTVMASHFGPSGGANGFMPRGVYVWFMVAVVVGLPALTVYLPNRLMMSAGKWINLPNRKYWLAPERRQASIEYLCRVSFRFGYLLTGFLAYVHWLVVRANAAVPASLNPAWFIAGLVVFVAAMLALVLLLFLRFGRVPPTND